jgi:hypothetical protein
MLLAQIARKCVVSRCSCRRSTPSASKRGFESYTITPLTSRRGSATVWNRIRMEPYQSGSGHGCSGEPG